MKKQIYAIISLSLLTTLSAFGQWSLLGTVKSVPNTVYELDRYEAQKTGEKFGYYNEQSKRYNLFQKDGKLWKTYNSATQAQCVGIQAVSAPNWTRQTLSSNSDFEYVYTCNENKTTGLKNFGIADETGKTVHYFNEPLGDIHSYKSGVFTYSKPFSGQGADTLRDVAFYKNKDGVLTLEKTFKETRFVAEVFSENANYNGTHYYEITKDRKLIVYKKDWTVFKTINLTMPNEVSWAAVNDFSVGVINNDPKWDFEINYIGKDGFSVRTELMDESAKILGKTGKYFYNIGGKILQKRSFDDYDTLFSMPQGQIVKIRKATDFKNSTSQFTEISHRYIFSTVVDKDTTVQIYNEKLELLKTHKVKKSGFTISSVEVVEQPDLSLVTVVRMYNQTPTLVFAYRIIYPDGTFKDLDGYNSFRVSTAGKLEPRIIFRKDNGTNAYDFDIYSFGKLSSNNELAITELAGVKVYPNPTSATLHISIDATISNSYEVRILDLFGRVLLKNSFQNGTELTIDEFANFEKGLYLIEVKDEDGKIALQKIVKN